MKRAYEKLCNYTQQCPVTFGVGSISTVKDAMGMLGVKKLFVVYDQGVKMSGLAEKVTKSLDEQGIDYIWHGLYDCVRPAFHRLCAHRRTVRCDGQLHAVLRAGRSAEHRGAGDDLIH